MNKLVPLTIGLVAIFIISIFTIFIIPSVLAKYTVDYNMVVIHYKDGSTRVVSSNPLMRFLGMDIVDVSNGKAIDHIDFYLTVQINYKGSKVSKMYVTGEEVITIAWSENAKTWEEKYINNTVENVTSGKKYTFLVTVLKADDLEPILKKWGLQYGDRFTIIAGIPNGVTVKLLDNNGNTLDQKTKNVNHIFIKCKLSSGGEITGLQVEFQAKTQYK